MASLLRVHIIPIGDDLVERIIAPAKVKRPDRVYLINFRGKTLFKQVFDAVKKQLIEQRVVITSEIFEIQCDFYNFTEVLQIYAKLMHQEQQAGNQVFFNVSTGGKMNSLAGMLACLLFGGTPYFCMEDFEEERIPEPPVFVNFPKYHIEQPSIDLVQFLITLQKRGAERTNPRFTKGECLEVMQQLNPDIMFSGKTSGDYNKLKFRYLDKLLERNYVTVDAGTRGKVAITEEGKFAADIFSAYYFSPPQ
jgi:hypothetical protein